MSLTLKKILTQEDLDANPELLELGAEVGEEVTFAADVNSISLVGPRPKDRD